MEVDEIAFNAAQRRLTRLVRDGADNYQPGGNGWARKFVEAYEAAKAEQMDYGCLIEGLSVSRELLKDWFPDPDTHQKVLGMISLLQLNAEKAVERATKRKSIKPNSEDRRVAVDAIAERLEEARTMGLCSAQSHASYALDAILE